MEIWNRGFRHHLCRRRRYGNKFERGSGLISTNNNNLLVEFKASQLEKDLITTDRKDLQELKERLKRYGNTAYGKRQKL